MDFPDERPDPTGARLRSVSPVIGAVLLLAIVVAIGAIAAASITQLGQSETREVAPQASLSLENDGGDYVIIHEGGQSLDMSEISVQGVSEFDEAETLTANDELRIQPTADTVRVVWDSGGQHTATLATLDVRPIDPYSSGAGSGGDDGDGGDGDGGGPTAPSGISVGMDSFDPPSGDCNDLVTNNGKLVVIDEVYACDLYSVDPVLIEDEGGIIGDVTVKDTLDVQEGFVDGELTDISGELTLANATITGPIAGSSDVVVEHSVLQDTLETPGAVTIETAVVSEVDSQSAVSVVDGAVDGDVGSQWGAISLDASEVEGEVVTNNDVTVLDSEVDEAIDAGGGSITVEAATVNGSLSAESAVDVTDGSAIHGTITTPWAPVTITDSTLVGAVETDADLTVERSEITGDLNQTSWSTVYLTDTTLSGAIRPGPGDTELTGSDVSGHVYASDGWKITCAGDASIHDTDCGSYAPP